MWSFVPSDMKDVPEIPGRDHPDFGTIMLEGDVCRNCGAMNNQLDVVRLDPGLLTQLG